MSDKTKYYVSVQAGTINTDQGASSYELEIWASSDEAALLQELFDKRAEWDDTSHFRAMIPGIEYHHDEVNDAYDYYMKNIYSTLYDLGTPETKRHIASMNVLDE